MSRRRIPYGIHLTAGFARLTAKQRALYILFWLVATKGESGEVIPGDVDALIALTAIEEKPARMSKAIAKMVSLNLLRPCPEGYALVPPPATDLSQFIPFRVHMTGTFVSLSAAEQALYLTMWLVSDYDKATKVNSIPSHVLDVKARTSSRLDPARVADVLATLSRVGLISEHSDDTLGPHFRLVDPAKISVAWRPEFDALPDNHGTTTGQPRDNRGTTVGQPSDNHGTNAGQPSDNHGTNAGQTEPHLSGVCPSDLSGSSNLPTASHTCARDERKGKERKGKERRGEENAREARSSPRHPARGPTMDTFTGSRNPIPREPPPPGPVALTAEDDAEVWEGLDMLEPALRGRGHPVTLERDGPGRERVRRIVRRHGRAACLEAIGDLDAKVGRRGGDGPAHRDLVALWASWAKQAAQRAKESADDQRTTQRAGIVPGGIGPTTRRQQGIARSEVGFVPVDHDAAANDRIIPPDEYERRLAERRAQRDAEREARARGDS